MSTIVQSGTARPLLGGMPVVPHMLARLTDAVRQAWTAVNAYSTSRTARTQLMALDDRMLRDIGLSRSEIDSVLMSGVEARIRAARRPR